MCYLMSIGFSTDNKVTVDSSRHNAHKTSQQGLLQNSLLQNSFEVIYDFILYS